MANKKTARRAFVSSVISLILCCSMLVGTTFAWFTDEVVSGNNIIKSGTLDVEMYYGDAADAITNDASTGAIFDYDLWEPGYTMVKYVKIANVGNLAFQFRLDIVPTMTPAAGEVNLADVIDVYMFDAAATVDRAAIDAATPVGTLAELMLDADGAAHGYLLPAEGVGSTNTTGADEPRGEISYCIVLKMQESAGNEYQNLSVGGDFKVQLLATQYTWENDSFDHTYDENAEYNDAPNANVTVFEPQMIETSTHDELLLEAGFQFKPEETPEEVLESPYRWWHADFVVTADRDIPANAVILPGYYAAYCDDYNDGKWIGLSSEDIIPAGTEIRLIDVLGDMMGWEIFVSYMDICNFGNDGVGFKCGVSVDEAQRAAIAGTTITVDLNIYEVENADSDSGSHNVETGNMQNIGTYTYTIPAEAPVVTP